MSSESRLRFLVKSYDIIFKPTKHTVSLLKIKIFINRLHHKDNKNLASLNYSFPRSLACLFFS